MVTMRCLAQYGSDAPQLYKLALHFLTSAPKLIVRHTQDLEVLHVTEERPVMPPLAIVVVQMLSWSEVVSVGLVKDWLLTHIWTACKEVHMVRRSPSFYISMVTTFLCVQEKQLVFIVRR
jgi:vacuolar protein sorting-associated protein 11